MASVRSEGDTVIGDVREAGAARPQLLERGRAWVVRTGRIDVFATSVAGG